MSEPEHQDGSAAEDDVWLTELIALTALEFTVCSASDINTLEAGTYVNVSVLCEQAANGRCI